MEAAVCFITNSEETIKSNTLIDILDVINRPVFSLKTKFRRLDSDGLCCLWFIVYPGLVLTLVSL
jgi:hypothetical protein